MEDKCHLCKKIIEQNETIGKIDNYYFHYHCYNVVLDRLNNFWELLTLPDNEFREWIEDDSQ